jgi:hypothetical protein
MKLLRHTSKALARRCKAIRNAISQLFRPKYVSAKSPRAGRIWLSDEGLAESGATPDTLKNSWDEHHADRAGAEILNRARSVSGRRFAIQKDITSPSSATVRVPAAGPYKRTAAKTNASDIEIVTFE